MDSYFPWSKKLEKLGTQSEDDGTSFFVQCEHGENQLTYFLKMKTLKIDTCAYEIFR